MTIKIEDLDEFEGLTADMVRAWLRKEGWTVKRADRFREWWEKGVEDEEDGFWLPAEFGVEWFWIHALAAVHGLTVQSLLREINPRMRAGWPSEEEIKAHDQCGGLWICLDADESAMVVGRFVSATRFRHTEWLKKPGVVGYGVDKECGARLQFWPCDQHGNKTRRGA